AVPVLVGGEAVVAAGVVAGAIAAAVVPGGQRRRLLPFQQRIALHRGVDLRLELGNRQLQQVQGLAQLWRQHQLLSERCLQARFHGVPGLARDTPAYSRKESPRYTRRTSGLASSAS